MLENSYYPSGLLANGFDYSVKTFTRRYIHNNHCTELHRIKKKSIDIYLVWTQTHKIFILSLFSSSQKHFYSKTVAAFVYALLVA